MGRKDIFYGYIIVRVQGLNPEKFINMASRNGIVFWDITRIDYTTIELKMKHNQYKSLKNIVKRTGTHIHIKRKKGINFIIYKISRRKFFLFGTFVFIAIILFMSSLVWKIEINGNKKISTDKIYNSVKKAGLCEGKFKYKINLRDIEALILKDMNEISVVNIKFIGTKAKVDVVERVMPPLIIGEGKPANIQAVKDGIITKIVSYRGQPTVSSGDFVREGQILISGVITDGMNVPTGIVRARGTIIAKTWYEAQEEVCLDYVYEERTGKVKKDVYVIIGQKRIYLKKDNIDYQKYDKIEEKNNLKIIGQKLPVEKVTEYYYQKVEKRKKLNYNQAVEMALKQAEANIAMRMLKNAKILDKKIHREMGNNIVKIKLLYITEEEIGEVVEIK